MKTRKNRYLKIAENYREMALIGLIMSISGVCLMIMEGYPAVMHLMRGGHLTDTLPKIGKFGQPYSEAIWNTFFYCLILFCIALVPVVFVLYYLYQSKKTE